MTKWVRTIFHQTKGDAGSSGLRANDLMTRHVCDLAASLNALLHYVNNKLTNDFIHDSVNLIKTAMKKRNIKA